MEERAGARLEACEELSEVRAGGRGERVRGVRGGERGESEREER